MTRTQARSVLIALIVAVIVFLVVPFGQPLTVTNAVRRIERHWLTEQDRDWILRNLLHWNFIPAGPRSYLFEHPITVELKELVARTHRRALASNIGDYSEWH